MTRPPVSVVLICRNAAVTIERTLHSVFSFCDDVVVVDNGSTDDTLALIRKTPARLIQTQWLGYGATKNLGSREAKHDWIFSIDADESVGDDLATSIMRVDFSDESVAFAVHRLNYLGQQAIHHGEWKNDWTVRLFNRRRVQWDTAPVHEQLILEGIAVHRLKGWLHHYTAENIDDYSRKLDRYASLMAEKYHERGRKTMPLNILLSPAFSFIKYYFFQLGLLDKKAGWQIARAHALYTMKKYKKLNALNNQKKPAELKNGRNQENSIK